MDVEVVCISDKCHGFNGGFTLRLWIKNNKNCPKLSKQAGLSVVLEDAI